MERTGSPVAVGHRSPTFRQRSARMAGEDLCSISGTFRAAEVRAVLKLGHDVKRNPARLPPRPRRQADGADV